MIVWNRGDDEDLFATRTEQKATPLFGGETNEKLYHAMVKFRSTLGNGGKQVVNGDPIEV